MRALKKIQQALASARAQWQRLVLQAERVYQSQVRRPLSQWQSSGSPSWALPQLPWWHWLLWQFLVLAGSTLVPRRIPRGQQPPRPPVRPGARVYYLRR